MQAAGYAALAQSGKILAVYARAGLGMQRLWAWLVEPKNQKALALLGSALVVCVGAGWAVFQEFFGVTPPSSMRVVENACGVGGGGRDVVISGISCNFGITLSEYERALARQEEMLRAELEAADKDSERQPLLEQNLEDVRERLGNIEAAFGERSVAFIDLARSLDGTPQKSAFTESFEQAVRTGDTSELEHKLRTDLDLGVRGAAARAYQLGLLLQQNGQVAEAYELFRRATILAPGQAEFEEALYRLADRLDVLLGNRRLRVSAVLTAGSEPTQARHFVFEPEADLDGNRKRIDYGDGIAVWFELPAGTYWIVSRADHAEGGREVQIAAAHEHDAVVELNAGRLRQSAVLAEGEAPVSARHAVFHPEQDLDGNRERIDYRDGEASWFTLPTGSYYVTAQSDLATRGQLVEVAVGKDRDAVTDLEAGRLRVSAVLAEGGEAIEGRHSIFLPEQGLDGDRERIAYRDGAASWFTVPAGTYYVGTEADLTHAGRLVEVFAGKDVGAVIALNAGRLRVAAKTADGVAISSQHSVYRPEENLDGQRERLDYRTGEARWFILPAGTYYVESQAGDLHAGREVQVVANATTDIVFDLPGNP